MEVATGTGRGGNDTAQLLDTERLRAGSDAQAGHKQQKEGDGQTETGGRKERKEERRDGQTH